MARQITQRRRQDRVGFIMTPMIDMVFLLITFFTLVCNFEVAEKIKLDLPHPDASEAQRDRDKDRVVINCELADASNPASTAVLYRVGPNLPEPLDTIMARLAAAKAANPDLRVIIRADRRLPFSSVREVMQVVAKQQIEIMNLAALLKTEQ